MLRFHVNRTGHAGGETDLAGVYLVGSDGVALRAEVELRESQLLCAKRADGPAALAILWPVSGCGTMLLETGRLMDRDRPYNLPLELVRGRLTRINQKREDWGLFDFEGIESVSAEIDAARDLFIEALKAEPVAEQSKLAEAALRGAVQVSEHLSQFHAELFLSRRRQSLGFSKRILGCTVDLANTAESYRQRLREVFDFACLPVPWRTIEPSRQQRDWRAIDAWIEWLARLRVPIKMGPLISFAEANLPDWLSRYESDFEAVRNLVFEHVRRVVERYGSYVQQWNVVSGIHAENTFGFNFEQLMELTRVTVSLVKQLAPRAQAVIDLVSPWGEYYARNQATIPPLLYADMVVQSGVSFDGIGVQFLFGAARDGMFVRDMFQISEKLDRLGNLGKPVHVTAVQVPSRPSGKGDCLGGCWLKPWNETLQGRWLRTFYTIAMSKPFVESITWRDLADRPEQGLVASGGLLHANLTPKPAFKALKDFRAELLGSARKPPVAQETT